MLLISQINVLLEEFSLKEESNPAADLTLTTLPNTLLKKNVMPMMAFFRLLVMSINHIESILESGASLPDMTIY